MGLEGLRRGGLHREQELMLVPQRDLAAVAARERRVDLGAVEGAADLGDGRAAVDLRTGDLPTRPDEGTLHAHESAASLLGVREGSAGGRAAQRRFVLIA